MSGKPGELLIAPCCWAKAVISVKMVVPNRGNLLWASTVTESAFEGLLHFDFFVGFNDVSHLDVVELLDV